jgi:8-oxo-dGTP diphosphatase
MINDSNYKPGKDYIGVGGGVLIFNDKGQVLLMKRSSGAKNEAGYWCKPGGTIEFGETAEEAMIREIKEELNLDIEIIDFVNFTNHLISKENQHWIALNFVAKIIGGELKNMEPHKHEEIVWFDLDNLPEMLTQTAKEPIEEYLKKHATKDN